MSPRTGGTVTPEEIRETVKGFFAFLDTAMGAKERESRLSQVLDGLAMASHSAAGPFDEAEYPDPVVPDSATLRARIAPLFPGLGWYNEAEEIAGTPDQRGVVVGDAINDLVDIARDLQEVLLRWESTSEADALWHFRFGFESHWGKHLRSLQLCLHARAHYPPLQASRPR